MIKLNDVICKHNKLLLFTKFASVKHTPFLIPVFDNKDRFCKNQSAPLFTKSFSALDQLCVTSHKTGKLWRNFCRNRPLGLRRRARGFRTHSKLFLVFHLTMDISKILPLAFAIRHQKRQKISILNHQYFPPYFSL